MHPHKMLQLLMPLAAVTALTCQTATAQLSPVPLPLKQALSLSETQNRRVLKSAIQKDIAEEEIKEAEETRLPDFDFHTAYARITNLTEFRDGAFGGMKVTDLHNNQYDATVTGSMPIYQGNRLNNVVDKAKLNHEVAGLLLHKTEKDVKLDVTAHYLGIYKLMQLDKLLTENVAEEKERLKEVKALLKNGTITKNEVLRAELQLKDREIQLINNRKDIEIAYNDLKTLLQLPEDQPMVIDTVSLIADSRAVDFAELQNAALGNEEFRIAQQQQQMGTIDVKSAKANYLPVISMYGSYTYKYPNFMFFPPDWNAYTFGQVGIQATYSLSGLYKNKSRIALAKKKAEAAAQQTSIVADENRDRIFRQFKQYEELLDKFKVTDAAETLATENYRLVKLQYLNQLVVITEMIDADNALLQAKYNRISARIDAEMKYYEMLHTAGLPFTK
ncbi:TolC family protein [Flavobacterium sp. RHBU_3]|uniref:TolC family protein n=1 Tax=Flavobacterium sp. RHBU_3 TaxID=3391184 RepID=UPI0039855AB0